MTEPTDSFNPIGPDSTPEPDSFETLAPLSALGLLAPSEQQALEQHLQAHPELAPELAAYQAAAAVLPYGLALPPAATLQALKPQLFERLGLPKPDLSLEAAFRAVRSGDLRWQASPIPKVAIATLHIDAERREQVGLLRAEPGMQYPPHTHGGTEEIYMLSGDLVLEGASYGAGDYIRSLPQSHHGPAYSVAGCLFFFRSSLDDQYPA
jgi:anti-sigma factor ChrR (cupin superfamily)